MGLCKQFWESERDRVVQVEREREREVVLFDVSRSYEELLERIKIERVDDYELLPYDENNTAVVNDDSIDNYIKYLPVHRIEMLIVANSDNKEMIKCLIETNNNTDGDRTRITYVDRLCGRNNNVA